MAVLRCARNDTARLCFLVATGGACPEFTLSLPKGVAEGSEESRRWRYFLSRQSEIPRRFAPRNDVSRVA